MVDPCPVLLTDPEVRSTDIPVGVDGRIPATFTNDCDDRHPGADDQAGWVWVLRL